MAGSCIVAIESRKHAASRPSPPLPSPASGSSLERGPASRGPCPSATCLDERIEQQVRRCCCRASGRSGTPSRGSRRAWGSRARRCARCAASAARGCPARSGRWPRSAPAASDRRGIDDVVEHQMPLVERVRGPREPDRAAAVLLEQLLRDARSALPGLRPRVIACSLLMASSVVTAPSWRAVVRSAGPFHIFTRRHVAVVAEDAQGAGIEQEVLAGAGRQPEPARRQHAQHDARARTARRRPSTARARAITRSTRTPTCSGSLAARASVPEDQPARRLVAWICLWRQPFVIAVVPFDQVAVDRRPASPSPASAQVSRARCSGLDEHERKRLLGQRRAAAVRQAGARCPSTGCPSCRCAGRSGSTRSPRA